MTIYILCFWKKRAKNNFFVKWYSGDTYVSAKITKQIKKFKNISIMKCTIFDMEQSSIEFKKTHTVNISGTAKTKTAPPWFIEFEKKNDERWTKQEQFNKMIMKRLDNLVSKNNLKE